MTDITKNTTQRGVTPLGQMVVEAMRDRKARRITTVDLSSVDSAPAREFIICEGTSTTQVDAIADNVRDELLKAAGVKPYGYDGYRASQWIVIDYGETLVHVFVPEARERYRLEELWSDADVTDLPDD